MQSSRCGLELVVYYISKLAYIKLLALRFLFLFFFLMVEGNHGAIRTLYLGV